MAVRWAASKSPPTRPRAKLDAMGSQREVTVTPTLTPPASPAPAGPARGKHLDHASICTLDLSLLSLEQQSSAVVRCGLFLIPQVVLRCSLKSHLLSRTAQV